MINFTNYSNSLAFGFLSYIHLLIHSIILLKSKLNYNHVELLLSLSFRIGWFVISPVVAFLLKIIHFLEYLSFLTGVGVVL